MTASTSTTRLELLLRLEHEAGVLIRRAKRMLGERARSVHPDLNGAMYLLLTWLADQGPVRQSTMVDTFGIDKAAVSRQIQHLEELGFVERTPDPEDGRATLVRVTDAAVRRLEAVAAQRRVLLGDRLADWTDGDLAAFVDQFARYNLSLS